MDSRERTLAALMGREVDRPPYSFWQHMNRDETSGRACEDAHIRFAQETGVDFLKVMNDGMRAPFDTEAIRSAGDWLSLRPAHGKNPYTAEMLARGRMICDALKDRVVIHMNVFAPLALARRIGDDRLAAHIAENPAAVKQGLAVIAEEQAYLAEQSVREAGCDGCVVCFQGAELRLFSPEEFDEYVRPYDMRVLGAANAASDLNIVHFCGWDEWKNRFSLWREYPSRAVNWAIYVDGMDLVRGRDYFGERTVFGGFDNRVHGLLYTEPRSVVMEETRRIVSDYAEATGSTRGLMIGADCSLLPDFERRRIAWVREALDNM